MIDADSEVVLQRVSDWDGDEGHSLLPCSVCGDDTKGRTEARTSSKGKTLTIPMCFVCWGRT